MKDRSRTILIVGVVLAILLAGSALFVAVRAPVLDPVIGARGTTNLDTLELSEDLTVADDVTVGDTLTVQGDINYDGDGFDVDTTGAISLDADAASNFNTSGAGIDLTVESEAGRVVIKGDEAAADGIYLDANDAAGTGLDIDVGSSGGMSVDGGCLNVGGGTPASCADNDAYIAGDLEVDTTLDLDGDLDMDGTAVDIDLSAGFSLDGDTASNIGLAAQDLTIEAETGSIILKADEAAADALYLDLDQDAASGLDIDVGATNGMSIDGGCLNIGGGTPASCGDNDAYITGDFEVDAALDLDGTLDMDGSTADLELSAGFSFDADTASNINLAAQDLTIEAETGSIIIKADEAAADALYLDLDQDAAAGLDIDVGATNGMSIDGGMVDIGTCTAGTASGDNDLCVAGVLEVDGELELDGALDADSTANFAGVATFQEAILNTLVNGAGASANPIDYTGTLGIMDGSDLFEAIDINITGAAHTGNSNIVTGIDIDFTTADPQVQTTAINVTDLTFDYAIQAGDSTIMSTAQTWFDDFLGDTIADEIIDLSGSDGQALKAVGSTQFGELQLTSGDDGANCAADCEQIALGLHWQPDQGALVFEARVHFDTAVANGIACLGMSDNDALEMPATIGGGDAITYVAHDFVGFCYDTAADTDEWFMIGAKAQAAATTSGALSVAPTINVYQVLRVEIDAAGEDARFYIDGTLVGSLTAGVVTITDPLGPIVVVDTNAAQSVVMDVDYVFVSSQRN